jgi:hypothetical protein
MIKLTTLIENTVNPEMVGNVFFNKFYTHFNCRPTFKYIGLKNTESIFTAPLTNLGELQHIISDAQYMARITDTYAYFGIIYTLNGLEQFDATVCYMKKKDSSIDVKLFDDSDSDFSDKNTNFIKLIKIMS